MDHIVLQANSSTFCSLNGLAVRDMYENSGSPLLSNRSTASNVSASSSTNVELRFEDFLSSPPGKERAPSPIISDSKKEKYGS